MTHWLSVKEYAALVRVHPKTVKRWIRTKAVTAERSGLSGWWRIRSDDEIPIRVERERFEDDDPKRQALSL